MTFHRSLLAIPLLALAACAAPVEEGDTGPAFLEELPEGLAEAAAPDQDLTRVLIMPEDGCYWYQYPGPVETTFLPLRTVDGRPICSRPQT
ncbi:MAG: hypothetical protein H6898_17320 [Rhodobacter sp.]|nr:hypothetical protein [Paracoccaceae bacterium]MCC0078318.1 hypothetical protein [Rhodobacter sp.]